MELKVVDKTGNQIEALQVTDAVFGVKPHLSSILLYIRMYLTNNRQGTVATKTRGDVSGGGRKPFQQKGTGRARAGSSRNPIWRKGGVAHGPQPRAWRLTINKKVKQLAMRSALSIKTSKEKLLVLDSLKLPKPKTTELLQILTKLVHTQRKVLLVLPTKDDIVHKSSANIGWVKTVLVDDLNVYDIISADEVIIIAAAVKKLDKKYGTK